MTRLSDRNMSLGDVLWPQGENNGCCRYVTTDAMGMAKEGDKPRLVSLVPESRVGTHSETPRCTQVRALRRDNTPSPTELAIYNNFGYNECSVRLDMQYCSRSRRFHPYPG